MTQIATTEIEQVVTQPTESGDHDTFRHYVKKHDLERAILDGIPATALCGKKWLPTKDPDRYPTCPECKDIWASLPPGD